MESTTIIDIIEQIANSKIEAKEDDYIDESTGLLYCGMCNTPKQCKIDLLGAEKTLMCLCKCRAEEKEQERKEFERKQREWRLDEMRKEAFSNGIMKDWTFENDDGDNEKITNIARKYVDNFLELSREGRGLLFYGDVGHGKTYTACEIANALIDKGIPCHVTNFANILNILQGTFDKYEYLDELQRYELLVIDDLGIERATGFAKEQIYNVINARYLSNKPMIITTNMPLETFKKPTQYEDKRIYDRILERCFPVRVEGGNKRYKRIKQDYTKIKELLGIKEEF